MAPINIDVSQATPQLELPSPVRAGNRPDAQSFDSHLQRASQQSPNSSAPANSTSADSNRDRQESPSQQTVQTPSASAASNSSPPAGGDVSDSQPAETDEVCESEETPVADAVSDESSEPEEELATEPVATDVSITHQPVVAVVEAATPIPVAVVGCQKEEPLTEAPSAEMPADADTPAPIIPESETISGKKLDVPVKSTPQPDEALPTTVVQPTTESVSGGDKVVSPDQVGEVEAAEVPAATEEVSGEFKVPETPKISSMHRYDVRQPATTQEIAYEVKPETDAPTVAAESAERVSEAKPTGRRSERNKTVVSDTDDTPNRPAQDEASANPTSSTAPAQVAAAVVTEAVAAPSDTATQSALETAASPAVADTASPAAAQTPEPPATRPLPTEPAGNVNRVAGGQQQVERPQHSELSESDRARFVQRVTKAFQTASERGGPLKLRLSPPELGSVKMEVSLRDGALSARLEAETPAARAALLENLPALRERLAEQNVRIEKFDVELFDQATGGSGNGPTSDPDTDRQPRAPHWRGPLREQESAVIAPAPVAVSASGLDQLNVVI